MKLKTTHEHETQSGPQVLACSNCDNTSWYFHCEMNEGPDDDDWSAHECTKCGQFGSYYMRPE